MSALKWRRAAEQLVLCNLALTLTSFSCCQRAHGAKSSETAIKKDRKLLLSQAANASACLKNVTMASPRKAHGDATAPIDWFQYVRSGEAALKEQNVELSKRYLLAALSQVSKLPARRGDRTMIAKLSTLEREFDTLYSISVPAYDSSVFERMNDVTDRISLKHERCETLYRLTKLDDKWIPAHGKMLIRSRNKYETAKYDYLNALKSKSQESAKAKIDVAANNVLL